MPCLAQHLRGPDGVEFKTTKGAPQIIAKLCNADNNPELKMRVEAEVANLGARGIRSLAVARTKPGTLDDWEMLGMLTFLDPPRPDTKHTIEQVGQGRPPGPRPARRTTSQPLARLSRGWRAFLDASLTHPPGWHCAH